MLPRRIAGLVGLSLVAMTGLSGAGMAGPISRQFALSGDVATPGVYDLASLSALPATTETVTYLSAGVPVTDTYTGTLLWTLLNAAGGIPPVSGEKNSVRRNYIVTVGSDG